MEKEFVPYQQALELKELGFDELCFATYQNPSKSLVRVDADSEGVKNSNFVKFITAPLYQQIFRWFREKYGLEGVIQKAEDFTWYKWKISHYNENGKKQVSGCYEYKTYEEAELECVKKLITTLK